jgi:hypothetical protein
MLSQFQREVLANELAFEEALSLNNQKTSLSSNITDTLKDLQEWRKQQKCLERKRKQELEDFESESRKKFESEVK